MGRSLALALVVSAACGGDTGGAPDASAVDASAGDGGADASVDPCAAFVPPPRPDDPTCGDPSADEPSALVACARGSGHAGVWRVDADGLPAYDFELEERCDPRAQSYTPREPPRGPIRDPVHLLGNGRGLVAMAHASGSVEIYTQDRGHAWVNRLDTWHDPREPSFPEQLAGGFAYVVAGGEVFSTRFEDAPVGVAASRQTRRFGVGYYETVTDFGAFVVRHRVLAPEDDARALVAEVTVENPSDAPLSAAVIEVLDPNLHELQVELATSDLLAPGTTASIDRRRRMLDADFQQDVAWDATARIASVTTRARSLPEGVADRRSVSEIDWFPAPLYLAPLDADDAVDAVWLVDDALFGGEVARRVPDAAALAGDATSRTRTIDGEGQHAFFAVRVPVEVAPRSSRTVRFALGYAPFGASVEADVARLRTAPDALFSASREAWRQRLVWAAFPGLPDAGVIQRELAWSTYNMIANITYDEHYGARLLGQGGSYKYVHGLDGAMGDLCLFADALLFVAPDAAADTLRYTLSTQRGSAATGDVPGRFPYATTGVGDYSDVILYDQRSDAYWTFRRASRATSRSPETTRSSTGRSRTGLSPAAPRGR